MKVNFHNFTGAMPQGLDGHMYYALGPVPPGLPIPSILPHGTAHMFLGINRVWRVATKVFVGLTPGLQSNWARLIFGHIPAFVPPPHPSEAASLATTIGTSSSSPVMTVHSVKGQGQALMTCLAFCVGANQNCGIPIGGGVTGNICSVKTTPSLGDYAAAAVGIMINAVFNSITSAIPENPVSIVVAVVQNLDDLGDSYDVHAPWYVAPLCPLVGAVRAASAATSAAQTAAQEAVDGKK